MSAARANRSEIDRRVAAALFRTPGASAEGDPRPSARTGRGSGSTQPRRSIGVGLRSAALALALAAGAGGASAVQPDEVLSDPRMEARARGISSGLRCLVCQNQSIDDSDAPLARDLRLIVRERLKAGDSDEQVQDYVVGRYGEYVLLRPVLALHTLLLWLTPIAVLGLGALGIWRMARRRKGTAPQRLTANEEAEIAVLTRREDPSSVR